MNVADSPLGRCVGDTADFADRVWGRIPLHRTGVDDFGDLLTLHDVDAIVASAARRPAVRLVADGEVLPESEYCTPRRIGGQRVDGVVDIAKVRDRLDQGATVVLQSLHRTWSPIARFTAALERELSHTVQANAYLTPAEASGLRPHRDGHDVIVIQLAGSKTWRVAELGELNLGAGDILYLPTGTEHGAETTDEPSLHLTIGILAHTYRQVIERLLRQCPTLDQPLPVGFARAGTDLATPLDQALIDAAAFLGSVDADGVVDDIRDRHRTRTYAAGSITSLLSVREVTAETVVVLADPHTRLADGGEGRVRLDLRDRTLHLPAHTRPAIDRIRRGAPVCVGSLPDLTPASRLVLVRRLIREGMVHVGAQAKAADRVVESDRSPLPASVPIPIRENAATHEVAVAAREAAT